jgi:hypothetical protein
MKFVDNNGIEHDVKVDARNAVVVPYSKIEEMILEGIKYLENNALDDYYTIRFGTCKVSVTRCDDEYRFDVSQQLYDGYMSFTPEE